MRKIENISKETFKDFGIVIEFSDEAQKERFEVIVEEHEHPWRIAMFRVVERSFQRLEKHPSSLESFEPILGIGCLVVAKEATPEDIHVFLLDKPICLYKGIWHQMISLSKETLVKITENDEVNSEFYDFTYPFTSFVDQESV